MSIHQALQNAPTLVNLVDGTTAVPGAGRPPAPPEDRTTAQVARDGVERPQVPGEGDGSAEPGRSDLFGVRGTSPAARRGLREARWLGARASRDMRSAGAHPGPPHAPRADRRSVRAARGGAAPRVRAGQAGGGRGARRDGRAHRARRWRCGRARRIPNPSTRGPAPCHRRRWCPTTPSQTCPFPPPHRPRSVPPPRPPGPLRRSRRRPLRPEWLRVAVTVAAVTTLAPELPPPPPPTTAAPTTVAPPARTVTASPPQRDTGCDGRRPSRSLLPRRAR